ncbi:sugar transporter [Oenococcus sp. UCMA 16435]|nr:sugar transporter [Oenococcus sp. UCMA 16435]
MSDLIIGLFPAIIWGIMPITFHYIKGSAFEQLAGTTIGTLLIALILFFWQRFQISFPNVVWGLLSGLSWSIGQCGQYIGYQRIGVRKVFPISTGFQIAGNSLIGGIFFHEWSDLFQIVKGFLGIAIILIGILIGNLVINHSFSQLAYQFPTYLLLLLTTTGYWGYSGFAKMIQNGNASSNLLPQSIGMTFMAMLLLFLIRPRKQINKVKVLLNTASGLLFGLAAMAYLISIYLNGIVNAFLFSQMNVVIATLVGIYIFKESSPVSLWRSLTGLAIIILGSCFIIW